MILNVIHNQTYYNSRTNEVMGDMNTRNFLHSTVMHENRQVTLLWTGEITNEDDDDAGNYGYQPNGQLIHTNYESAAVCRPSPCS